MSSYDSIYKKMAESLGQAASNPADAAKSPDAARHVSPAVAHELNNILTIITGYSDRLLLKYHDDEMLQPHLKLISEAARRAVNIVREANNTPAAPRPASNPAQIQQARARA